MSVVHNLRAFARNVAIHLFVTCSVVMVPATLTAQLVRVPFIPGLNEFPTTWTNLIDFLEDSLDMDGRAISLITDTTYAAQAQELKSRLSSQSIDDAPGVAHSNGGVVARLYSRNYTDRRLDGLLTVGTPHTGTPLARQGNIDFVRAWLTQFASAITQTLGFYASTDGDPNFNYLEFPVGYSGWMFAADWFDLIEPIVVDFVADVYWWEVIGFLSGQSVPASSADYVPEAAVFNTLNTNNWGESSILTTRVSISTNIDYYIAPWLMWTGNGSLAQWLMQIEGQLCYFAYEAYWYYLGHPDPVLQAGADSWAMVLQYCPLEYMWHVATTDATPYPAPLKTDGLLALSSTEYPNNPTAKRQFSVPFIPHTQQAVFPDPPLSGSQAVWFNEYKYVLHTYFGIAEPPPPLTVSISGPGVLELGQFGSWTAHPGGGVGGYTYQWYGLLSGTNQSIQGAPSASGTLYVKVTSGGQTKIASRSITVTTGGPPCCD